MMRRLLLVLPIVIALLLVALYFAADAWLESSGGRQAIEKQLSAAAGSPVRLAGAFELSLLPVPGAEGTELRVLDAAGDQQAHSRVFRVDLALKPLLQRQLRVERLELEWLTLGAPGGSRFSIPSIAVSGFEPGREAGLEIGLGWLGAVGGTFTWRPGDSEIALDLSWAMEGSAPVGLAGIVNIFEDHAAFANLEVTVGGQELFGRGCLVVADNPRLDLDLHAGVLDVEALAVAVPGGQGGGISLPLDINLRLAADELVRGDLRATGSVLEIGDPPSCP